MYAVFIEYGDGLVEWNSLLYITSAVQRDERNVENPEAIHY
jgi:hypothetical protein